jgi:hypothetical protein
LPQLQHQPCAATAAAAGPSGAGCCRPPCSCAYGLWAGASARPMASRRLGHACLESLGWHVVALPLQAWQQAADDGARQALLQAALHGADEACA